jgi:UDP-GlcNAc:undecaprenyl-phosphate GlcNAc-1-phosphate transferase
MTTLFVVFALSLATSLAITPVVRGAAVRCGLVDRPDGRRKTHARVVPAAGGIALLLAVVGSVAFAWSIFPSVTDQIGEQARYLLGLALASTIICALGVLDDLRLLHCRHKLVGQLLAVAVLLGNGVLVNAITLFDWHIELGLLAAPFTAFFLLGAINSLNFLDGMDGMLASVGVFIGLAIAAMAVLGGQWITACIALALAGGLLGFLRYNFPPASIFLGDSGSMLTGLLIGVVAIQSSLKAPATIALIAPTVALTIPILDMSAALVRRKLTGRGLWATDRGHLHHRLLGHGISNRGALLLVAACCVLTGMGAIASRAFNFEPFAVITALAVVCIVVRIRLFGHAELRMVWLRITSALPLRMKNAPQTIEIHFQGSVNWDALWGICTSCAQELQLQTLRLDVNAPEIQEGYNARWIYPRELPDENPGVWQTEIPLMASGWRVGHLAATGVSDGAPVSNAIVRLLKLGEMLEGALADVIRAHRQAAEVVALDRPQPLAAPTPRRAVPAGTAGQPHWQVAPALHVHTIDVS